MDNQLFQDAYLNVCLVLDNDIVNQLCTDTTKGFSGSEDEDFIIWDMPTENTVKVGNPRTTSFVSVLEPFQFRCLKIKGIDAAFPISLTLILNHLKCDES